MTALSSATYGEESGKKFAYQAGTTAGLALTADFSRYHKKDQPWVATGAGQGWVVNASWRTDNQDGKRQIVCPGGDLGDNETPATYQAKGCAWATVPVTIDPATGIGTATVPAALSNTAFQLAAARYQANKQDQAIWFHRPGLYLNVFAEDATYRYYDFGCAAGAISGQLSNWNFGGSLSDLVEQLKLSWWPGLPALTNAAAQANLGDPLTVRCAYPAPPTTTKIILYSYNVGGTGDLKTAGGGADGRLGADTLCRNAAAKPAGYANYRAFISVTAADEIRDMPANYGVPTTGPILSPTGTTIANNWADLLDGTIAVDLTTAGVVTTVTYYYTGANADGSVAADTCQAWTSSVGTDDGAEGNDAATDATWLNDVVPWGCDNTNNTILCLAY